MGWRRRGEREWQTEEFVPLAGVCVYLLLRLLGRGDDSERGILAIFNMSRRPLNMSAADDDVARLRFVRFSAGVRVVMDCDHDSVME